MDFGIDEQVERFRAEVRDFLAEHVTDELLERVHRTGTVHDWGFHRALAERGWIGAAWPAEEGGQERDPFEMEVLYEECVRAGAPLDGLSTTMIVAETLRRAGTEAQRRQLLPRVRNGEILISLGYSEPEAGSDVAAVKTRARRDGDGWVIDGQKAFTTLAHEAGFVFVLARTDPDAPRHRGLTLFLVPTDAPGFGLDPIHTLGGERTNMTYYSGVRVSDEARVGEVNGGWNVLMLALAFERGGEFVGQLDRLIGDASALLLDGSAGRLEHDRIGRALAEAEVARLLGTAATWKRASGGVPETEGAMAKLYVSEALERTAQDFLALAGSPACRSDEDPAAPLGGALEQVFRHSVVTTIYGGTSEILRSLIAERGLGLPRAR